MKIAIVTDGDNTLGMGHIYQSISLANAINQKKQNKAEIFFLTKSDEKVIEIITEGGYSVYQHPDDNSILNFLRHERPERIIFDKLDVAPDLARKIKKELNSKLIILTNLTEANSYADITVLADIGSNFKNIYKKDKVTGKAEFFGPKYWMLRPEFYEYKERERKHHESLNKLLLIFGGADSSNLSSAVLHELLQMDTMYSITLVLGAAFLHHKELDKVLKQNRSSKNTVNIVRNMKNVAESMYNSDLVIASPGLSFFEALAVGTPVIGFHQNELQRDTYIGLLTTFDKNEVSKLPFLLENKAFIFPTDPFITNMEIGEGKSEIIHEILN